MKSIRLFLLLTSLILPSTLLAAELRLASVFGDHMVLQRDKAVPVWGWAKPGEVVRVSFAGQAVEATAGEDGKWSANLAALEASAEGRELSVQANSGGDADHQERPRR